MRDANDPGTVEMELPLPARKRGRPCSGSKPMSAAVRARLYRRRRALGLLLSTLHEVSDAALIDAVRRNIRDGEPDVRDMYIEELVRRHHSAGKIGEDALYAARNAGAGV